MKSPEYDEVECLVAGLEGPCHVCRYAPNTSGYCQMYLKGGKQPLVHRWAWEQVNGPIPDGMVIDHRCRVPKCFNVKHLRVVTKRINAIENSTSSSAVNAAKRFCIRGHEFDLVNTIFTAKTRLCRKCQEEQGPVKRARANARYVPRPIHTHCRNGHEFTPENTKHERDYRRCRICLRKEKNASADRRRTRAKAEKPVP